MRIKELKTRRNMQAIKPDFRIDIPTSIKKEKTRFGRKIGLLN